jgi:hypothetical protein
MYRHMRLVSIHNKFFFLIQAMNCSVCLKLFTGIVIRYNLLFELWQKVWKIHISQMHQSIMYTSTSTVQYWCVMYFSHIHKILMSLEHYIKFGTKEVTQLVITFSRYREESFLSARSMILSLFHSLVSEACFGDLFNTTLSPPPTSPLDTNQQQ